MGSFKDSDDDILLIASTFPGIGRELARYDTGSRELTTFDLTPGPFGSGPDQFTPTTTNRAFFRAYTESPFQGGFRVGTSGSPVLLADYTAESHRPNDFCTVGNQLFYTAGNEESGREIWTTNGFEAPYVLKDINPGPGWGAITTIVAMGDHIFFWANDGVDTRLWTSDGTESGTRPVPLPSGEEVELRTLPTAGFPFVYFAGSTTSDGDGMYRATAGGMERLDEFVPTPVSESVGGLTWSGSKLFFFAETAEHGYELWHLNGETPELVVDLEMVPGSSGLRDFTPHNGRLYFTAETLADGRELYSTLEGGGVTLISGDLVPGASDPEIRDLASAGTRLFFVADEPVYGREIWYVEDDGVADAPSAPIVLSSQLRMRLGPNPFVDELTLHLDLPSSSPIEASLFDVSGRIVASMDFGRLSAGRSVLHWPLGMNGDRMPRGIYFTRVQTDRGVITRKIVSVR